MPGARVILVAAGLALFIGAPHAQRPSSSFDLVVSGPLTLEGPLERLAREGFTCAAVARPIAPLLSRNVAVIVGKPRSGSPPGASQIAVVYGKPGPLEDFETAVNATAAKGFRMCGFTIAAPVWGRSSAYTPVAVMSRTGESPADTVAYRIIRTTGRREEWANLEKSAAEGFAVSRLVSRPESPGSYATEVLFVAERTAGAQPLEYRETFAANEVSMKKNLDKAAGEGFRIQALWATSERVTVLLSRPTNGAKDPVREYEVDDPSDFRISSFDGALVGLLRFKDGAMGFYEPRRKDEYSLVQGVVTDSDVRPVRLHDDERWFVEKLKADGERGFWPFDFVWRQGQANNLSVDVILERQPAR